MGHTTGPDTVRRPRTATSRTVTLGIPSAPSPPKVVPSPSNVTDPSRSHLGPPTPHTHNPSPPSPRDLYLVLTLSNRTVLHSREHPIHLPGAPWVSVPRPPRPGTRPSTFLPPLRPPVGPSLPVRTGSPLHRFHSSLSGELLSDFSSTGTVLVSTPRPASVRRHPHSSPAHPSPASGTGVTPHNRLPRLRASRTPTKRPTLRPHPKYYLSSSVSPLLTSETPLSLLFPVLPELVCRPLLQPRGVPSVHGAFGFRPRLQPSTSEHKPNPPTFESLKERTPPKTKRDFLHHCTLPSPPPVRTLLVSF